MRITEKLLLTVAFVLAIVAAVANSGDALILGAVVLITAVTTAGMRRV